MTPQKTHAFSLQGLPLGGEATTPDCHVARSARCSVAQGGVLGTWVSHLGRTPLFAHPFCQLPSTMEEWSPAAPNEQRMPRHTSAEDVAWQSYVNLSSCIGAYSPEYPRRSWSRTSTFGQPGVRRAEIQAPSLPVSLSGRHEVQIAGQNETTGFASASG